MKNKIQLMLLTGAIGALTVLSSQKTAFSQEKTNQTQLSDGPQTLPATDAAASDATDAPDETTTPKTEVIPSAPSAPAETAVETLEEAPPETAPVKAEPAK